MSRFQVTYSTTEPSTPRLNERLKEGTDSMPMTSDSIERFLKPLLEAIKGALNGLLIVYKSPYSTP